MEITESFLANEVAARKAREKAAEADLIAFRAAISILEQLLARAREKPEDGDDIEEPQHGNDNA